MKQIRNTYRNHFSRSYENRSIIIIYIKGAHDIGTTITQNIVLFISNI